MDKNLTDNEITIKALKELLEVMLSEGDLQRTSTVSHTIDLINRLQTENESLKNAYKQCAWERDTFQEELKTASAENERLSRITRTMVGEIKAEAYTKFAERLKEKFKEYWYDYDIRVFCDEVDNLLKEMIGE